MSIPKTPTKHENKSYEEVQKEVTHRRIQNILNANDYTDAQRKVMKDFYGYCQRKGLRLESQRSYLQNLKILYRDMTNVLNPKESDIDEYLVKIEQFKPKTNTERRMFLIRFYSWYYDKNHKEIPFLKDMSIKKNKGTKLPEELLSPKEIKKMLSVANNFRDKCVIILLYETAARKGEFLQLKVKHIEIAEHKGRKFGFVTVPMGKTESRKIPIIYGLPHVINWINSHPNRDEPSAPLFPNQGAWLGRAMAEDGLKRLVKVVAQRSGINKKIYPHLFRHSRLTELAKELTEQELKKFAGWTPNSNMASVYIHLSGEDVSNKLLANAGLIDAKRSNKSSTLMSIECPSCKILNAAETKICQCGRILDLKTAQDNIEILEKRSDEASKISQDMEDMKEQLQAFKDIVMQVAKGTKTDSAILGLAGLSAKEES